MQKELTKEDILQAIKGACQKNELRELDLTFKPDKAGHIYCLLEMHATRNIQIWGYNYRKQRLMEIMQSCDWGNEQNRNITISLGKNYNERIFVDRMHDALEKIELGN